MPSLGRPSLAPGVYFRLLLLGYLLGIDSERGIALTVSDSLSLRAFLGYELNAALRTLRRKDTQQGYREFVEGLAAASGVATPTVAELAEFDRKRKGKTLSNKEWESPTDADARVAKMQDGTTHLAHKAEHAVDLESGALVGVTLPAADRGDTATLGATLAAVEAAQGERPERVVADKGYHSDAVLVGLEAAGQAAHIPEPQRAKRDFEGQPAGQPAVEGNRERVGSAEGKQLQKLRTEKVERSMAHMYETGAMRRLHLRGRENILKRLLVHASAFNLGVLMRSVTGIGTPRTLQGQGQHLSGGTAFAIYAPLEAALSGILGAISRISAPDGQNRTETGAELA